MVDNKWNENKLIGNQAEDVVKFLIKSMPNWECIPYGIENHIIQLKDLLRGNDSDEGLMIRNMPDFIAINKIKNKILIIDVKYQGFIDMREPPMCLFGFNCGLIRNYLDFWSSVHLIIVHHHDPHFYIIPIDKIEWHKHFHDRRRIENNRLIERWDFSKIQMDIKELFPELSDDILKKAIKRIPLNPKENEP